MIIFKKIKYWILKTYRKILNMTKYVIVVQENYEIDADGKEIPETREELFFVKNEITSEIIKRFHSLDEAKEFCKNLNNPRKPLKP